MHRPMLFLKNKFARFEGKGTRFSAATRDLLYDRGKEKIWWHAMAPTGCSHVLILPFSGDEDMIAQLRVCKSPEIARDYQVKGTIIGSIFQGSGRRDFTGDGKNLFAVVASKAKRSQAKFSG